jgi:NodT family efflux transporter outer membrane factor (OMF) lipoprotein
MSERRLIFLSALIALFLGGCAVGPNYHPPQVTVPPAWSGVVRPPKKSDWVATTNVAELSQWWQNFRDPQLTALVVEALRTNLDLQLAEATLRQTRASRGIIAGGLWPGITGTAGYSRNGVGRTFTNSFQAGLSSVWQLDVFGGIRRDVESANATILAANENLRDAQVTLASEVALNYIQLRGNQEQIAIAEQNLKAEQHTAVLTRQRLSAGFASALDTANAEAQVAMTAAAIPVLETALRQNIYALSVLLARPPAALLDELSKPGPVPLTPPNVPVGLPSTLLRRRPDVRAAEAQLHAATAQIGVAEADFFPQFSLTGSINYQTDLAQTLFAGGNRFAGVGPQMTWPILQGGSITSNVRLQKALRDQAYITYRKTVLTALQDVENALVAFANEWDHRQALVEADNQNRRALDLSMKLYSQGAADFLSVLVAERSLYASQSAAALSKMAISTDLVALYTALGGGWTADPEEILARKVQK